MAKTPNTIECRLPGYRKDRSAWRRAILRNVLEARDRKHIAYEEKAEFEVVVLLYLKGGKRHDIHDVDNRLKDILDALQGRLGASRTRPADERLFENDNQVSRVLIEKQETPKALSESAGGRILIRPYREHHWPLQGVKSGRPLKKKKKRQRG